MPGQTLAARVYTHGGFMFAFVLVLEGDPLTISELNLVRQRTRSADPTKFGDVNFHVLESPLLPDIQVIGLLPTQKGARRRDFQKLLPRIFRNCVLSIEWVTRIEDDRTIDALQMWRNLRRQDLSD
jgi:hypothetical protein